MVELSFPSVCGQPHTLKATNSDSFLLFIFQFLELFGIMKQFFGVHQAVEPIPNPSSQRSKY